MNKWLAFKGIIFNTTLFSFWKKSYLSNALKIFNLAQHNETGQNGEALAGQFLQEKGYQIIATNWRIGRNEVDIIASKGNCLHFIEVKTNGAPALANPEKRVGNSKLTRMKIAAEAYLQDNNNWKFIQFDVVSVTMRFGASTLFFLVEDVF